MIRALAVGAVGLASGVLTGCTVNRTVVDHVGRDGPAAVVGETTHHDVLESLGPPSKISALDDGFVFLYEAIGSEERIVGVKIFRFGLGAARADLSLDSSLYIFDDRGVLAGAGHDRVRRDLGRGFTLGSKGATATDQFTFVSGALQHRWGMSLLRPLPRTLNAGSDMDSGTHGLERRGTSAKVGQRTLESGYSTIQSVLDLLKGEAMN